LSANAAYDAGDILLGSRAVGALGPGATDTGSLAITIPAGTATGTYYVIARADDGGVVAEVSEGNNTASRAINVGPDIVIYSLAAPAAAGAGDTITVTVATRNAGSGIAPASTTQVWYSNDWVLGSGDVLLATRAVPELAPGAIDTGTMTVVIPAGALGGSRYLIAQGDGDGAVVETQEANNSLYRAILIGADLDVAAFTVPTDGGAGLALVLTDTTRNSGGGTAAASTTSYYLSANGTFDAGDVLLGSRAVPALAAGASDTATVTVTIPAGTATGNYTVFAVVDSGGVVTETYENNNSTGRSLRVGPDLTVTSLTGPANASPGASIVVNDVTRNAGGGTAAASVTRYYLSTDGLRARAT
jgi:subtilase family serine protease